MHQSMKSGACLAAAAATLFLSGSVAAKPMENFICAEKQCVDLAGCSGGGGSVGGLSGGLVDSAQDRHQIASFQRTERAAGLGAAQSQFELGQKFEHGEGVAQSYENAMLWYGKAAAQGYADAQQSLGQLYVSGLGGERNYAKAAEWLEKAARQGKRDSAFILGVLLTVGDSVPQDHQKAAFWYEQGAMLGSSGAQLNLGISYLNGTGVQRDVAQAYKWLAIAEANREPKAEPARKIAEAKLTSEQLALAQAEVKAFKPAEHN
jgi:uncharacterized protein